MNILYKIAFGVVALHYLSSAYANNALHKIIPLTDIEGLYATGNVSIEIKRGEQEQAEVFLRKDGINDVVISVEDNSRDVDQAQRFVLRIREQPAKSGAVDEDSALAHIILTLNKLNYIFARDVHHVSVVNGYHNHKKRFSINLRGDSRGDISIAFDQLKVQTSQQAKLNIQQTKVRVIEVTARNTSKVAIDGSDFNKQQTNLSGSAQLEQRNTNIRDFTLKTHSSAQARLDESNQVASAEITSHHQSHVQFSPSELEVASGEANQNSRLQFGAVGALNAHAKDKSMLTYQSIDQEQSSLITDQQAQLSQRDVAYE
jgi:hypothetical protein